MDFHEQLNDKHLVIICTTFIGILAMIIMPPDSSLQLAGNIVSGLFGVAVGRALEERKI